MLFCSLKGLPEATLSNALSVDDISWMAFVYPWNDLVMTRGMRAGKTFSHIST